MSSAEFDRALDQLDASKSLKQAKSAIWESFMGKKCSAKCGKNLRIALLNAPCYGFGDVIFAQKLAKYLKEWYGATIHIFTTLPDAHIKLGESPKNLIKAVGAKTTQCRTFAGLDFGKAADAQYDLYFVAPLVANFSPNVATIAKKFKYATKSNVFFFSEYNSPLMDFDFPTGVGGKRMGLMLVKPPATRKLPKLPNPYALIYIASSDHIARAKSCYMAFMEMVAKKYHTRHKKLDIVVPPWIVEDLDDGADTQLIKKVSKYYPRIIIKDKEGSEDITDAEKGKTLTIRGDILPVDNKKMFALMKHSVKDILLTGDQSITDALSCCAVKNIFYQIAEWKESFGRELAKELPNKFLKTKKTSCGTLKAIRYTSNYRKFVSQWDFRKLARPKLDAIVLAALALRKSKKFRELQELINKGRTLPALKKKANKL